MAINAIHRPDDGRSMHVWNIGLLQRDYIPEGSHLQKW
jgi:hypothetical protein